MCEEQREFADQVKEPESRMISVYALRGPSSRAECTPMSHPPTNTQRLAAREAPAGQRQWMHQTWRDLLFLHWRFDAGLIQRTLPPGLAVDTFDGSAWVGIVPFRMCHVRPVGCPPVPGISDFLELNVRTYVYDAAGRPGVWFYSLDANCWPAVLGARWSYHLPYHWARMTFRRDPQNGRIHYASRRRAAPETSATELIYARRGIAVASHDPASLPYFLLERYFLFAFRSGRLFTGQVAHHPYEVSGAEVPRWDTRMLALNDLPMPTRDPDHAAFSTGVSVRVFGLQPVG